MTAATLWAAVVDGYESRGLISLTNPRDRSANSVDTTYGEKVAQSVIDVFALYAQADYDSANAQHVEVAMMGCIALLWRRGGTASNIEKVKWDSVFGDEGIATKLRQTGARGVQGPSSNASTAAPDETINGRTTVPWSHPQALPGGYSYLPSRKMSQ